MKPKNNQSILSNHLTLVAIAILLAGGLYLYFSNATTALAGGIALLLLAHVAVIAGVLLLARGWLAKLFRKLHE